eukprot:847440-Prymnesium_polylepis.1
MEKAVPRAARQRLMKFSCYLGCVEPQDVQDDKATEVTALSFSWCRIEDHALRNVHDRRSFSACCSHRPPSSRLLPAGCLPRAEVPHAQRSPAGDAPAARTCADASPC